MTEVGPLLHIKTQCLIGWSVFCGPSPVISENHRKAKKESPKPLDFIFKPLDYVLKPRPQNLSV